MGVWNYRLKFRTGLTCFVTRRIWKITKHDKNGKITTQERNISCTVMQKVSDGKRVKNGENIRKSWHSKNCTKLQNAFQFPSFINVHPKLSDVFDSFPTYESKAFVYLLYPHVLKWLLCFASNFLRQAAPRESETVKWAKKKNTVERREPSWNEQMKLKMHWTLTENYVRYRVGTSIQTQFVCQFMASFQIKTICAMYVRIVAYNHINYNHFT